MHDARPAFEEASTDLRAELPLLLPLACEWAVEQAALALETGVPLTGPGLSLAVRVGVRAPEVVRVLVVPAVPVPDAPMLRTACAQLALLGPATAGLTLGSAIFIRRDHAPDGRLLAHELRHVAQYERFPSIPAFLAVYLLQLLELGYEAAPLEEDARTFAGTFSDRSFSGTGPRRPLYARPRTRSSQPPAVIGGPTRVAREPRQPE